MPVALVLKRRLSIASRAALARWAGLAVLLGLALTTGCATIDEADCPRVDWLALGVQDGAQGYPESRLREHRRACRDVGVTPDERAYFSGRADGLRTYCTLPGALREGQAGRAYNGVCVGPLEAAFREVHGAAYRLHEALARLRETDQSISYRERDLRKDGLSDRDRERIRSDLRDLDRRRSSQRGEIFRAERDLDLTRQRYRI